MKTVVESFTYFNKKIAVCTPALDEVQTIYQQQKKLNQDAVFPYWAKLWPSSIAMASFIANNPQLISNKKVLELGAGLGLPSLVAAQIAQQVVCSDYVQEPLNFVQQSIEINQYNNVFCSIINWSNLPLNTTTEVLLLSDINYEPTAFVNINLMLQYFLQQGSLIILTTPQRLMAKQFIEAILPFCIQQEQTRVDDVDISIFVLMLNKAL
jgi:predicted nicotinamide N-methyase